MGKKIAGFGAWFACATLIASCAILPGRPTPTVASSVDAPEAPAPAVEVLAGPESAGTPAAAPAPSAQGPSVEAETLKRKAAAALESNHLAEAILSQVAIIALFKENGESLRPAAEEAARELARIGSRLTIEPGSEWLDAKGGQIAGEARQLGGAKGLPPSIYLYENFGAGKSPVADAPIRFEFVKNSGSLASLVSTDAYGKANTTVSSLDAPGSEAVIRAYPVFTVRGTSFAFRSVFRDFTYLPPPWTARLLMLEGPAAGMSQGLADSLIAALKPTGLELQVAPSEIAAGRLELLRGGDRTALDGLRSGASYAVLAFLETSQPRQIVLNGKAYDIFNCEAVASFRVVDGAGSAVFVLPESRYKGQGATARLAEEDALRRAREGLASALTAQAASIRTAIGGK